MEEIEQLFEQNKQWAHNVQQENPGFFDRLASGQKPRYLWIGCSDSRMPETEILGLQPGEIFVHRNIANVVPHTDMNVLSVLQFSVQYLEVEHVIVCGHYKCGGVEAAMQEGQLGLIDNWLRNIRDVYEMHRERLLSIQDPKVRFDLLVELNVCRQVLNVAHTTIIQNAWDARKKLKVHGWVNNFKTGLLKDLKCTVASRCDIDAVFRTFEMGALG